MPKINENPDYDKWISIRILIYTPKIVKSQQFSITTLLSQNNDFCAELHIIFLRFGGVAGEMNI